MAHCDKISDRRLLVDQHLEDLVQHRVGRQAILVLLVLAQLCRGGLVDHAGWDHLTAWPLHPVEMMGVAPAAGLEHACLVEILDRVIAARHVAIDRGIAHRDLGFIAGGQKHLAELVRQRHEHHAAQAGLDVFLGQIGAGACKERRKRFKHRVMCRADRHGIERHTQTRGHICGIVERALRGKARGQHDAAHLVRPQRIGGDGRHQRAVDPPRKPQEHTGKPRLGDVIAQAHDHGVVVCLPCVGQARLVARHGLPSLRPLFEIHMEQPGQEGGHLMGQCAMRAQNKACPIENLVVLPA